MSYQLKKNVCPICKNKRTEKKFIINGYDIDYCLECRLEYNANFPPSGTKERSFSETYYKDVQKEAFAMQEKDYLLDPSLAIYKIGLNQMQNFTSGRRLLDVGTGLGAFMKFAYDSSWEVEGVEISSFGCKFIQEKYGFKVCSEDLLSVGYPRSSFDAVTFWDVIEHVELPKENLKRAYDLLKPEGVLLISTDNYNSLIAGIARMLYFFSFGMFKHPIERVFTPYNKTYLTNIYMDKLLKETGFHTVFFQKIQYPLAKFKLNKTEKIILNLLYKLERFFKLQSQFIIIAKKG